MKYASLGKITGLVLSFLIALPALSNVTYQFDFTNLKPYQSGDTSLPDFGITLNYADYITSFEGMQPLTQGSQPTSLGYSINYVGNAHGSAWGFDDDGSAVLSENGGFLFNGSSIMVYLFNLAPEDFISAPGTYFGAAYGNTLLNEFPSAFDGNVKLTVSESTSVPEPTSLMLLGLGLLGCAVMRRRKL